MNFKKPKQFIEFFFYLAQYFNTLSADNQKLLYKILILLLFVLRCPGRQHIYHPSYKLGYHHKVQLDFFKNIL
jgi:hypothetical protein